jgi:hypothetical protein
MEKRETDIIRRVEEILREKMEDSEEDEKEACIKLWKAVARKLRIRGSPEVWAASVYHTYCWMVFKEGRVKSTENLFGVSKRSFGSRSTEIKRLLNLNFYDRRFTPDRIYAQSPLAEIEERLLKSQIKGIEGFFEVKEKVAEGVLLINLQDGKEYFVKERTALEKLKVGHVVSATIFPRGDHYVFPGIIRVLDPSNREHAALIRSIKDYYSGRYIEKAIEAQRDFCEAAKEFFGSSDPIFRNARIAEKALNDFLRWFSQERKVPGKGKSPSQLYMEKGRRKAPEIPKVKLPREFLDAKDVGVVFDEVGGICILPEYGKVKVLFQGDFRRVPGYKDLVRALVYEKGFIPSFILRRLIEKNPERAVEIFAMVFRNIRCLKDVLSLLEKHRTDWNEKPKPTIIPINL